MNRETEQSRADFEAHVASVIGSPKAMISLHWIGEGYTGASDLEPFWRLWTAAQKAVDQPKGEPVALTTVAIIRERDDEKQLEWLLEGGLTELEPGQYLIVADQDVTNDEGDGKLYRHPPEQIMMKDREELIGQLADEIGRRGMCSTVDRELFKQVIDANYRKQVAP